MPPNLRRFTFESRARASGATRGGQPEARGDSISCPLMPCGCEGDEAVGVADGPNSVTQDDSLWLAGTGTVTLQAAFPVGAVHALHMSITPTVTHSSRLSPKGPIPKLSPIRFSGEINMVSFKLLASSVVSMRGRVWQGRLKVCRWLTVLGSEWQLTSALKPCRGGGLHFHSLQVVFVFNELWCKPLSKRASPR